MAHARLAVSSDRRRHVVGDGPRALCCDASDVINIRVGQEQDLCALTSKASKALFASSLIDPTNAETV